MDHWSPVDVLIMCRVNPLRGLSAKHRLEETTLNTSTTTVRLSERPIYILVIISIRPRADQSFFIMTMWRCYSPMCQRLCAFCRGRFVSVQVESTFISNEMQLVNSSRVRLFNVTNNKSLMINGLLLHLKRPFESTVPLK